MNVSNPQQEYHTRGRIIFILFVLFQLCFWVAVFFFYDEILRGGGFFRVPTPIGEPPPNYLLLPSKHSALALDLIHYMQNLTNFVCLIALFDVYINNDQPYPLPKKAKWGVSLLFILLYLPVFYYMKYMAPHYRFYMQLLPTQFVVVLLGMLMVYSRYLTKARSCQSHK